MKIAVFHGLPFGGAKRVLYEEMKALSKEHEIHLYQLSGERDSVFNLERYAKEVHEYNFNLKNNLPLFFKRFYADYKKLFILRKLHKKIAIDINGSNFDAVLIHPDQYTQAPFVLRYLKTKKIYFCHELLRIAYEKELQIGKNVIFLKRCYETLERQLMKNIDKANACSANIILTNSLYTKQNIRRAYQKNSTVCYPGVDTIFFKPIKSLTKDMILFIGDEDQILGKGFESKVLSKKYKFEKLVRNKNNSDEYLKKLYNRSLITVCLTRNEPFGMVPLESMSCGTPVIALNDGGYKETIVNNKIGFLIDGEIKDLKNKLSYFISNPSELIKMGNAGRNFVKSKFTWEKHMEILEKALIG
jgi:glycosyltransferase involved in cell wall biosynthesis